MAYAHPRTALEIAGFFFRAGSSFSTTFWLPSLLYLISAVALAARYSPAFRHGAGWSGSFHSMAFVNVLGIGLTGGASTATCWSWNW